MWWVAFVKLAPLWLATLAWCFFKDFLRIRIQTLPRVRLAVVTNARGRRRVSTNNHGRCSRHQTLHERTLKSSLQNSYTMHAGRSRNKAEELSSNKQSQRFSQTGSYQTKEKYCRNESSALSVRFTRARSRARHSAS